MAAETDITNPPFGHALHIQFSDDGRHIRKWAREPFDGGAPYIHAHHARQIIRDAVNRPKGVVPVSAEDYYR